MDQLVVPTNHAESYEFDPQYPIKVYIVVDAYNPTSVTESGLKLSDPPAPVSQVLGLQTCAINPESLFCFWFCCF